MSRRYQHKKTDSNQKEIIKELRQVPGLTVEPDHDDILIGYKGLTYWFELKNPDEVNKNGEPYDTKSDTAKKQKKIQDTFTGHYKIVYCIEQIFSEIGIQSTFNFKVK